MRFFFYKGKHERMHMISTQTMINPSIPSFLNEKINLKRKNDDLNDIKINKYQKTSISSSLSPSSTSSTMSLAIGESNNSQFSSSDSSQLVNNNNNHILEFILKSNNRMLSDEGKENHCSNNFQNHYTEATTATLLNSSIQTPFSAPSPYTASYINKIEPPNFTSNIISNSVSNNNKNEQRVIDDSVFPKNKYKKFLSNFNQQKQSQYESVPVIDNLVNQGKKNDDEKYVIL
jgi:hypothetical protein